MVRSSESGFDGFDEVFVVEGAIVTLAVDEEGWSAVDSATDSAAEVGTDAGGEFVAVERCDQGFRVEVKLLGELLEERQAKAVLVFEEKIMHLPEFVL